VLNAKYVLAAASSLRAGTAAPKKDLVNVIFPLRISLVAVCVNSFRVDVILGC